MSHTDIGSADPHDPIPTHNTEVYQLVGNRNLFNRDQEPKGLQLVARQGCPRGKEASIHCVSELELFTVIFFHSVPTMRHVLSAAYALAHGRFRVMLKGAHYDFCSYKCEMEAQGGEETGPQPPSWSMGGRDCNPQGQA